MAEISKTPSSFFTLFPASLNKTFFLSWSTQDVAIVASVSKRLNELAIVTLNRRAALCVTYLSTRKNEGPALIQRCASAPKTYQGLLALVQEMQSRFATRLPDYIEDHHIGLFFLLRKHPNVKVAECLETALKTNNFGGIVTQIIASFIDKYDRVKKMEGKRLLMTQSMRLLMDNNDIPHLKQLLSSGAYPADHQSMFSLFCQYNSEYRDFEKILSDLSPCGKI